MSGDHGTGFQGWDYDQVEGALKKLSPHAYGSGVNY